MHDVVIGIILVLSGAISGGMVIWKYRSWIIAKAEQEKNAFKSSVSKL